MILLPISLLILALGSLLDWRQSVIGKVILVVIAMFFVLPKKNYERPLV